MCKWAAIAQYIEIKKAPPTQGKRLKVAIGGWLDPTATLDSNESKLHLFNYTVMKNYIKLIEAIALLVFAIALLKAVA